MTWARRFWLRLQTLFRRGRNAQQLDDEIQFHLDQQIAENLAAGMSPQEARYSAKRTLGNPTYLKEETRDTWGWLWPEQIAQDLRYAGRILHKSPGFTAVAVLTLALGIGANTAIFSLIDTVILQLLPVKNPQELVQLFRANPSRGGQRTSSFTNALWEQVRDHQDVFSRVFSWSAEQFDLTQGGQVHYVDGIFVSGGYFDTLGVRAAAGRLFATSDDQRGCPALAVLSYSFWQEHFGGERSAIGSTLSLNNHPFQVIGVSAPGFYGVDVGSKFDVAIPVCTADVFDAREKRLDHRSWWWLSIIGRVKPGISPEQLKARLAVLSPQVFAGALPDWDAEGKRDFLHRYLVSVPASTGTSDCSGCYSDARTQFSQPLTILMGVVGLVLLIASANLASLMFARATSRNKEIAVRKALGASRGRLIRHVNANLAAANILPAERSAVYEEIESRLRSLPGIVSVGRSTHIPVSIYEWSQPVEVDTPNPPKGVDADVYFNAISSGYLQTLRNPLLAGRNFEDRDTKTSIPVAIVNETFARRFFPGRNPIGAYFRKVFQESKTTIQIVGLVKDAK